MKLTITDVNFSTNNDWLFKLENINTYFIMDSEFYRKNGFQNPIKKEHLDSLDKGSTINANVKDFYNKKIVIEIY